MAEVTTETSARIDRLLNRLTEAWRELPAAERDIDNWDIAEQIEYIEEWTPKLDGADHLQQLMASSSPTEEQRRRYRELRRLMKEHRPILDRLRAS